MSRRGRWLLWLAVAPVGAALAYVGYVLVRDAYFYPSPPAADFPPPSGTLEARRQDLDYFRHYLDLDRSYTAESRARAEAILRELAGELAGLTDAGFELGIARAVAAADNGHSNVWLGRFSRKHGRVPVRLHWFADGIHVVRAHSEWGRLLGARLDAVGGVPVSELASRLEQFVGGTREGFRAYRGPVLFELPAALHAVGAAADESQAEYTFRLNGVPTAVTLPAHALSEDHAVYWSHYYLLPGNRDGEPEGWVGLVDDESSVPLYLREPDLPFRLARLPDLHGLYVQYRQNFDADGHDIGEFGKRVRAALRKERPALVIVDQRFNGGGDYTTTQSLMSDLPVLLPPDGVLYVITGHATFSAGITSVAFARAAAPEQVIIIGERIGDPERAWGETNDFELPHSGLGITFSTGLHDVANGCHQWPECYWTNFFNNVAAGSLDPDVPVPTRFSDYESGRDPVLEAIRERHPASR